MDTKLYKFSDLFNSKKSILGGRKNVFGPEICFFTVQKVEKN